MSIGSALPHVAERIAQGQPLTIVAIGSSSTWGVGASTSARNYPSLLEAELRERFPNLAIRVLNRGKNGEDAAEESARLDADAIAERPDLVIWQVGTNAVLRRDDLTRDGELIEQGVARLRQGGSDVVLMDLQYAPRVLARPAHAEMEQVIASIAKRDKVGLFRRFEIMQHWQNAASHGDSPAMIGDDGLHMTDRGYGCLAADFAEALAWNWWTQERVTHNPADARVAGLRGTAPPAAPFDGRP
ncbi:MAG TPA: SGNH/GDSL hydrolase family protein [Stellaceae bacterium]|jgi:lysophospholipase L1-like esterase|nr:SGNH/GDSL hydrolase family protein [Stellaceae bacterium]